MNRTKFTELLKGLHKEELELNRTKGQEYCRGNDNVHKNFESVAQDLDLRPEKVLYVYMKKHWDAITSYVSTGQVQSESLRSRVLDLRLYAALLYAMEDK